MPTIVLASASPARLATLRSAGLDPHVVVSGVDEPAVVARYGVTDAEDVCLVLARAKAEEVAARDDLPEDALVVGCDSVLEVTGPDGPQVHGKPADAEQAVERWRAVRGRSGVLHTGHWVVDAREDGSGATLGGVASVTVHFADVTDEEVAAYVATGEPLAVAGAFTLDGLGGAFVRGVEGDPHAVVGISLPMLRELLREAGVVWTDLWRPELRAGATTGAPGGGQ
ncbi:Maf family protein [Kineococcus sp. SYSU DK004]|uniref:Maf family protein n=1 Tax=Kineococcus sp. SYSU DK004 TaxID=3383125 RepID=UPI003D7CF989